MRSNVAMADYILVRVFTEEKRSLKEFASKRGMSLSEYIRSSSLGGVRSAEVPHGNS